MRPAKCFFLFVADVSYIAGDRPARWLGGPLCRTRQALVALWYAQCWYRLRLQQIDFSWEFETRLVSGLMAVGC
jgi:hypothetical protein